MFCAEHFSGQVASLDGWVVVAPAQGAAEAMQMVLRETIRRQRRASSGLPIFRLPANNAGYSAQRFIASWLSVEFGLETNSVGKIRSDQQCRATELFLAEQFLRTCWTGKA
jgi:hypothetical protein